MKGGNMPHMIREIIKYAVCGAILIGLLGAKASQDLPTQRFLLFQGESGLSDGKQIIKLDTWDGSSWFFVGGIVKDTKGESVARSAWIPIEHRPAQ